MFDRGRFKVAMVAVVLVVLLTATGGLVISQAAAGRTDIRALLYNDVVRFTIENGKVALLRAEVFDLSGKRLFDSGPVIGISNQRSAVSSQQKQTLT